MLKAHINILPCFEIEIKLRSDVRQIRGHVPKSQNNLRKNIRNSDHIMDLSLVDFQEAAEGF